jgi:tripartite-type tricarboxylate transporter receptor subunit TctC
LISVLTGIGVFAVSAASAQEYPSRSVKLVIPFAAGATNDIVGRLIATKLGQRLGQPVVAENRTGAGGTIGAEAVAKAPADGYTLLLGNLSTMVIAPLIQPALSYSPERDFVQIINAASAPLVLVVHPSLPVRSLDELVSYAKQNPDKLSFASPGAGTPMHLMGELLKMQRGIQMTHVAYRGGAPAVVDLLAGRVQLMFDNLTSVRQHIASGALRAISVSSPNRMALLPDVPTVVEAGARDLEVSSWFTIAAPRGVPTPIVARLQREIAAILKEDDVKQRLAEVGTEPTGSTTEAANRLVKDDVARWTVVVEKSGARAQ